MNGVEASAAFDAVSFQLRELVPSELLTIFQSFIRRLQ